MEILNQLRKNRLFMMGLLIPFLFQLIFLCIALPAIKDGNSRIHDMKIAIVNEDAAELNGKIAGFVMATIGGPEYPLPMCAWINIAGIDPAPQGQGAGGALVRHLIDTCQHDRIGSECMIQRRTGRYDKMLMSLGFKHG